MTDALVATGKPDAADVASRVTRMLDTYTQGWVTESTEACRATRIRGDQTEQLHSLRVVCLERRLQDVKAVAGVLARGCGAGAQGGGHGGGAALAEGCADVATLSQVEAPPEIPKVRGEIERISGELSRAQGDDGCGPVQAGKEVASRR